MNGEKKKTWFKKSSARVLISVILVSFLLTFMCQGFDARSKTYLENNLKRVLTAYVAARALNAAISVMQEFSLSINPLGVGVSAKPGEILDPLNDIVERFSNLLLISAASITIMNIIFFIFSGKLFYAVFAFLSIIGLLTLIPIGDDTARKEEIRMQLAKILFIVMLIRFGLPGISYVTHGFSESFLMNNYNTAIDSVENMKSTMDMEKNAVTSKIYGRDSDKADSNDSSKESSRENGGLGFFQRMGELNISDKIGALVDKAKNVGDIFNVGKMFDHIQEKTDKFIKSLIMLTAVFLLETILVPVFLLWVMLFALRRVWKFDLKIQ